MPSDYSEFQALVDPLHTMLSYIALCVLALASVVSANFTADSFIDSVLRLIDSDVRQRKLDPLRARPFEIKTKLNGTTTTNQVLQANFTQGFFFGLSGLSRAGNCSYTTIAQDRLKMECYISLGRVRVAMDANVKGDTILGSRHAIETSTLVHPSSCMLVELQGRCRDSRAKLQRVTIQRITMISNVVRGTLNLRPAAFLNVTQSVHYALSNQLTAALLGRYSRALHAVVGWFAMP